MGDPHRLALCEGGGCLNVKPGFQNQEEKSGIVTAFTRVPKGAMIRASKGGQCDGDV